jgi:glucoamylase
LSGNQELDSWIARQFPIAVTNMLLSVSATGLVKRREGFGQTVVPARGSVLASPVPASYDPEPDYFFHWYRDSAVVMDALRLVGTDVARGHFRDFVAFSLGLDRCDGKRPVADPRWRDAVSPGLVQYLREDAELAAADIRDETRVNPDGSRDILRWSRPQHDGIAMRILTVLRWMAGCGGFGADTDRQIACLLGDDLRFVLAHWREPGFDLWEEEKAHHYYTLRLQGAALEQGAGWLQRHGEEDAAHAARTDAAEIMRRLDDHWSPQGGFYRSRLGAGSGATPKDLDIAVILAAIHAGGSGRHSPADARVAATLDRLDALFEAEYPINRARPPGHGPALGRYQGDVYYSGGAYYFSTLGAAEFCYLRACTLDPGPAAEALLARGDAYLETVRSYTPTTGDMAEQFDRTTGAQNSARHLAWSYAAFISAVAARRRALG